jgi:pyruvate dehydrogenase E2 component (dihydrolipoamide acetyltransferase)
MAYEVVMPQLGLSMDSGQIIQWLKKDGDPVKVGDLLLEVESDKSTVEVEAVENGFLKILQGPAQGDIPVGEVIAYLLAEGEPAPTAAGVILPSSQPATGTTTPSPKAAAEPAMAGNNNRWPRPGRPPSTPAARRRAQELSLDWRQATPSGLRGEIKERDVLRLAQTSPAVSAPAAAPTVQITPVARRLAESVGLDLALVARQHPGKRLEREDVEQTIRQLISSPAPAPVQAPAFSGSKTGRRQPLSRLRKRIGERMSHSARTYAPVTLTTEADATEMVNIRAGLKADPGAAVVPSYNAMFARLAAKALMEHPALNASLEGDEIVYWENVHIGIAVDADQGLVVPVLRSVQARSLSEVALEMESLLQRGKEGKALPDELTGGTFTITNLGGYEIDSFTPIINPPETAVLGLGRLVEKWVVYKGEPKVRTMISLSLTFDHRLVDGAPAARFLQRIKQLVEQPYLWLV